MDMAVSGLMSIPQGIRDLVKNARRSAKQTFIRLETRVLRPDKMKFQQLGLGVRGQDGGVGQLESGIRGQEGGVGQMETGVRGHKGREEKLESEVKGQVGVSRKLRLQLPLEQTTHEEYYSSLAPP